MLEIKYSITMYSTHPLRHAIYPVYLVEALLSIAFFVGFSRVWSSKLYPTRERSARFRPIRPRGARGDAEDDKLRCETLQNEIID